ncbi:TonB-dependent siderophore receptor [Pigmentiphaga aceris]|uniref:TonB-dependent siderophore receptor n=1 Tax=Pigmentiphaga aceris TaxID=1940612 RepID=UPI001FE7086F|nr:TonB-dependent siderophore receptor [Pigmentiphaga aceris]
MHSALLAMICTVGTAQAQSASAGNAARAPVLVTQHHAIAAGPLDAALANFAASAGVSITMPPALVQGKTTPGLQGTYSVGEGFARLLAGSGLEAAGGAGGAYALRPVAGTTGNAADDSSNAMRGAGTTLAPVTVTARAEQGATTDGTRAYTSRAVTVGKGEQALKDIPQSVSVLTRQRMDDQNLTSLADAVNNTTGLVATQGVGAGIAVTARGFMIDSMQYDGVPVPRNTYSLGNWGSESLVFYDRVEVLRGAAGLLQGGGSPGGTINFVRKRGQAEPTVTLTGKAGSWDSYGAQLDAGGPLNKEGSLRGRVVVDEDRGHSHIDYVWQRSRTLYAALDYDIDADTTVGIGISNKRTRSRPSFVGLPRFSDGSDIGLPRSTYTGASWNRALNDQTAVYADAEHRFNDRWTVKASAFGMNEQNTSVHQRMAGTISRSGAGAMYGDFSTDLNGQHRGLDVYLRGRFEALSMSHEVTLGANVSRYTTNDRYARAWTTGANIFNINHDRPWQDHASIAARGVQVISQYDVRQEGIYGAWRAKLAEPLTMILGGRVSWYDQVYAEPTSESAQRKSARPTPYAGLVYALSPQWSAYTSYSDVFELQSARTASGAVIKPITGTNLELGIKGELADGRINTSLALFRYEHRDRAVPDYASGMICNNAYCSTAAGKVRSQGVEAEVSGEVLRGLQLFAGYTYNTSKFLDDPVNEGRVFSTWTPRHLVKLWADYRLPGALDKFSVGGGVNAQSHALSYDRVFKVPGFSIWNARVAYQLNDEVALALNVNNLSDKRYYIPSYNSVSGNNYYGTPRSVMFTVKYTPKL